MEAAAIEEALFRGDARGEQPGHHRAQRAADAVYRDGANGVVYSGDLVEELDRQHDHDAEHCPHDCRAQRRDRVAACGDAHQTCERGIVGHGDVRLAVTQPCEDERHAAGNRRRHVGVEEDEAGALDGGVCVHGHGGSAVEAKPTEPEDEHAQRRKGQVVPRMARGLPSLPYLPRRGPSIFAPMRAQMPPTMCTAVEPAKSWKPSWLNQPPPQIQWPETG